MRALRLTKPYLSLTALRWADIPPLAILTGLNGVGKTQFLEALAAKLGAVQLRGYGPFTPAIGVYPRPGSAGYLPARWQFPDAGVSHHFFEPVTKLTQILDVEPRERLTPSQLFETVLDEITGAIDVEARSIATRVARTLSERGQLRSPISRADVLAALDTYELITRDPSQPLTALAQIFYAYVNARVTAMLSGVPQDQLDERLGRPPWDQADDLLRRFEMSFQLTRPDDLRFPYELRCRFPDSGAIIKPGQLSSGEQAVLALVALVVTTSVLGAASPAADQKTELLLLDEPDAHLNTSKVKSYLDHVQQLTERGVQIIMVTHRPDTIALAPEGSLFEMRRADGKTSIVEVASKAELIGRLAADTVAVLPGVRVVLVEDEDDRRFHQRAYDCVLRLRHLPANPRLVFMPVNATGGGGKDTVMKRMEVLRDEGLGAVHRGLVDGDHDTGAPPSGVVRLDRYTLESYLADPVALYCAVVSNKDTAGHLELSRAGGFVRGDLGELRAAGADTLQRIADLVLSRMEQAPALASADRTRQSIRLHGKAAPVSLQYPRWLFTATKKDLRTAINQAFGGQALGSNFQDGPDVAGLFPEDLVETYRRLVTDRS